MPDAFVAAAYSSVRLMQAHSCSPWACRRRTRARVGVVISVGLVYPRQLMWASRTFSMSGASVFRRPRALPPRRSRPSSRVRASAAPVGATPIRRGGRAVDCTGLENRRGLAPTVGSNPTLSAKHARQPPRIAPHWATGSAPTIALRAGLRNRGAGQRSQPWRWLRLNAPTRHSQGRRLPPLLETRPMEATHVR